LDSPLPADRRVVLRAVVRHLETARPTVVVVGLAGDIAAPGPEAGAPDLMLLAPGGRCVFVQIKTQAAELTRPQKGFADLCRGCAVPLLVVRSLPEACAAFDRLNL
ncbi:hypothetical protein P7D22_21615, partial [Lichenihabitans sp. Uapishka_5]|nr:hypothetical protein [Lichenihabitans sp. Uapishka_5]